MAPRVLMLCPYFGPLPPWIDRYLARTARLHAHGFEWLLDRDLDAFRARCRDRASVEFVGREGGSKIHDLRPLLGFLYAPELEGYDFWGHTDLDCVYGRVERWMTPEFLAGLDVYSNHWDYVCGPWTLYRNNAATRGAFMGTAGWRDAVAAPETTGWAETAFTKHLDVLHDRGIVRRVYQLQHVWEPDDLDRLTLDQESGALTCGDAEVMMAHFRRTKAWPVAA